MWLASPSDFGADFVMVAYYDGILGYTDRRADLGFRPIVCLNSNVTLKSVEGGYEIE